MFMSQDSVVKAVSKKGTKFATVRFVKADGTERVINGLFRPKSHIIGSDRGISQGEAMKARGQIPIWESSSKKWKSFYANKVIEIT